MSETALTPTSLVDELIAEAVRDRVGSVGVLVRDVPEPEPRHLLATLERLREDEGVDLRVAYLREGSEQAIEDLDLDRDLFSHRVEQAEEWRNQRDLTACIVVIAHGAEAKLSSLEEFSTVTSRILKGILVRRALGGEGGDTEVQTRWWKLLGSDESIGLGQIIDYYIALSDKKGSAYLEASSREIFRLGLLPDPNLFDDPKENAVKERLQKNKEMTRRFQTLTPQDRKKITESIGAEKDPEARRNLQVALDQLHRTRWAGEGMRSIQLRQAEKLVRARAKKMPKNGTVPKTSTEKVSNLAAVALLDDDAAANLDAVVKNLSVELENLDDTQLRPQKVTVSPDEVSFETATIVRADVLNFVKKMLHDGIYGGWVKIAESDGIEDALRRFNFERHVAARWERDRIVEFLEYFAETTQGEKLLEDFLAYDGARSEMLTRLGVLATEPLAAASLGETRDKINDLIGKYETLIATAGEEYGFLTGEYGSDVDEALGNLLLTDTIVLEAGEKTYAVLAPTHPLYLWHYARYCQIVAEQRDRLDEQDRALVVEAAKGLPNFLTSLFVPPTVFGTGKSLPYLGRLGPLPYFGERTEMSTADDGVEALRSVIEAQLALEPHARYGLRLALVDPPSAGAFLSLLTDLSEAGSLFGAHLTAYFHPGARGGVDLRTDEGQEDRIARTFQSLAPGRRFTFEVRDLPGGEVGPAEGEPFHLVVVFDRSSGKVNQVQPAGHILQPLALPQKLKYKISNKLVELEPSSGGPFGSYYDVVQRLAAGGAPSYLSVHQDAKKREALEDLASRQPWTVIAGRHVDRDLSLGVIRVFTARDGERDVAAFARDTSTFRRPLRDVVRTYNAYVSDEDLDDLLKQLSGTLDSGLLDLKPDKTGKTDHNRVQGLLGTLIAARWFRNSGSGKRLLISLDSPEARRWLRLRQDNLRADLVGFEWKDDRCIVSAIEVKAVQSPGHEYTIKDRVARGPAVQQVLATRRLLGEVFAAERTDELVTTPARREILREHLYRELAKGTYSSEARQFWAGRLQKVLDGVVPVSLTCHLVGVRLGVDDSALQSSAAFAEEDGRPVPIYVQELNHKHVSELSPPPDEDLGGETEGGGDGTPPSSGTEAPAEREKKVHPAPRPPASPTDSIRPAAGADARVSTPSEDTRSGEDGAAPQGRVRALLGAASGAYGRAREVWFDPHLPGQELPNAHISVTGETGSGKTQATKAVVRDLSRQGIRPLILDFKDDYSDRTYADGENLRVYDPSQESLPFNPLSPQVDLMTGRVNPISHVHQLSSILKRVYGLGDQQTYKLREATKRAYEANSVPAKGFEPSSSQTYPPFEEIRAQLEQEKGNGPLLGRMSPIFDLDLFSGEGQSDFAAVVEEGTVIRLGQLPGDETKNSVAELFLMAFHRYLLGQPQTHRLSRLLILDEAWRLMHSPFLEPLIREGRAFGLGVLVATQFPSDLPEEISGNTATKLFFSQTQQKQIREIQRTITGKTSGPDADDLAAVCRELAPLTCVLHSKQYSPYARVRISPYFERNGG